MSSDAGKLGKVATGAKLVQSILTSIAIVAGGVWAIVEFDLFRPHKPRINISQTIKTKRVIPDQTWVQVEIKVENVGEVRAILADGVTRIQQVLPIANPIKAGLNPGNEADLAQQQIKQWPLVCERSIEGDHSVFVEAGETERIFQEFFVPYTSDTLRIYTYIANEEVSNGSNPIGWRAVDIVDLPKRKGSAHEDLPIDGSVGRIVCGG